MRPLYVTLHLSTLLLAGWGCSTLPANPCGELVRTPAGSCDCPEGSTRDEEDWWLCHLPDGGQIRDPNAPPRTDGGSDDTGPSDSGFDGGALEDGGYDAGETLDAGPADGGCPDRVWYRDRDRDGFGDDSTTVMGGCAAPEGYVAEGGDCDDECSACHPFAPEICDERDNNCNDEIDEGLPQVMCYRDRDGDGFGDETTSMLACACRSGWTQRSDVFDCADREPRAFPGQTEYFTTQYCAAPPGWVCALGPDGTLINGSWDYNCDGRVTSQYSTAECAFASDSSCRPTAVLCCYDATDCGTTVGERESCFIEGGMCRTRRRSVTQACR
ncbi:MAG: putative metal-binding motif-containing protein [Myxococcales bacterium]|nr:putative metal-binding motif-containing protein [Myxococcales bacterium]